MGIRTVQGLSIALQKGIIPEHIGKKRLEETLSIYNSRSELLGIEPIPADTGLKALQERRRANDEWSKIIRKALVDTWKV